MERHCVLFQFGLKWGGIYRKSPSKFGRIFAHRPWSVHTLSAAQVGNLIPNWEGAGVYILGHFLVRGIITFPSFLFLLLLLPSTMAISFEISPYLISAMALSFYFGTLLLSFSDL